MVYELLFLWCQQVVHLGAADEGGAAGLAFHLHRVAFVVFPSDLDIGTSWHLDAAKCGDPGWMGAVDDAVEVEGVEARLSAFELLGCQRCVVVVDMADSSEIDVFEAVVILALKAMANERHAARIGNGVVGVVLETSVRPRRWLSA